MENNKQHVVVLVHGIRDFALWQSTLRPALERAGFGVELTNYGRLNLLEFLLPLWPARRRAIAEVSNQLRIVQRDYPGAAISVIAHSFGTYIIAEILKRQFDSKFKRVIFCGSVVPYDFAFEQISSRFEGPLLNEVGTNDPWPAIAESIGFGFGAAGTYGFRRPLVVDRWHNGAGHGYFLSTEFCKTFWIPFISEGLVQPGSARPRSPKWWVRLLSIFKLKYVCAALLLASAALSFRTHFWSLQPPNPLTFTSPEAFRKEMTEFEHQARLRPRKEIDRLSSELTEQLFRNESTFPREPRREMNSTIVEVLRAMNNNDLSLTWSRLPSGIDLTEVNLRGTKLMGVHFLDAFLIYADLTNADLSDAIFETSSLRNANFSGAVLSATSFPDTDWFNTIGLNTDRRGVPMELWTWKKCPRVPATNDFGEFIKYFNTMYGVQFSELDVEDRDALVVEWRKHSMPGAICDRVASAS